jgi:hypothetical protein
MSSKDVDRTEALRRELVGAINQRLGMGEQLALPVADAVIAHLQDLYAGERLYIPQPVRRYNLLAIEAELRRGDPPAVVARRHATSPRNLRRLFPGGLPKPDRVA